MSLGEARLSYCGPNMAGLFAALVGVHDHRQNQNGTRATLEAGWPCCCWARVNQARLAECESLEIIHAVTWAQTRPECRRIRFAGLFSILLAETYGTMAVRHN